MDTLFFILKKILSSFIYPLNASIPLILSGFIFLLGNTRRRVGLSLVGVGLGILVLPSLPVVERELTASLEKLLNSPELGVSRWEMGEIQRLDFYSLAPMSGGRCLGILIPTAMPWAVWK